MTRVTPWLLFGNKGLDLKKRCIALKGGECQRCHKQYIPDVYDFHHKNPATKAFTMNQPTLAVQTWNAIKDELKKVVLLCANCHRMVHALKEIKFISTD